MGLLFFFTIFDYCINTPRFKVNNAEALHGFYDDLPNAFHSVPTCFHKALLVLNINVSFLTLRLLMSYIWSAYS